LGTDPFQPSAFFPLARISGVSGGKLAGSEELEVIDHFGFVEGVEGLVIAARGNNGMGIRRRMG
jgi:hypothetical protein